MRYFRSLLKAVFFVGFALFASSILLFILIELYPKLIGRLSLNRLPYYLLKERYIDDPELVFRYKPFFSVNTVWIGDDYSPEYKVAHLNIPYVARYNESGFRTHQKDAEPADVVVLGDSYVEIGSNDAETFPSLLQSASGQKTANLGIAWYGPYQYLKVLTRYGLTKRPKVALFCFFEGNDLRDTAQYKQWMEGKPYYWFQRPGNIVVNYCRAAGQTGKLASKAFLSALPIVFDLHNDSEDEIHPNLAKVKLRNQAHLFAFGYRNDPRTPEEIEHSEDWKQLVEILRMFRKTCNDQGITPLVLYLPSKTHIYARFTTTDSGRNWLEARETQIKAAGNTEMAVAKACKESNVKMLSITPLFDSMADEGRLLYYPFDSHWNTEGRKAAAKYVAEHLSH